MDDTEWRTDPQGPCAFYRLLDAGDGTKLILSCGRVEDHDGDHIPVFLTRLHLERPDRV